MATVASSAFQPARPDVLSGTPRAHAIDRWIYVFTAASFVAITLVGFVPDSIEKLAMVKAGVRPPLPWLMHLHAVLMGSFLLLLLAQTWLTATGKVEQHMRLGLLSFALVPALVVVGFNLAPLMYREVWQAYQAAAPGARDQLRAALGIKEDILLIQTRIGLLFPLFIVIGLLARKGEPGFHKRMMILATAVTLPAGIDRISWLPTTFPQSLWAIEFYILLAISPMFAWDVIRNRSIHRAYWVWLGVSLPVVIASHALWDTPWWHQTAHRLMSA